MRHRTRTAFLEPRPSPALASGRRTDPAAPARSHSRAARRTPPRSGDPIGDPAMNLARCALCALFVAATLATFAAWRGPVHAQESGAPPMKSMDGNYLGTDPDGSYQKALDAAIARAQKVLSPTGTAAFHWTVTSVGGAVSGTPAKREITVTIHAT